MHLHLALTSVLLLAACAPKSADSDDGTGSSAADTEGAEATSATGTPTTGDDPTAPPQMSAGTAPDPSTSTSTTTAGTSATSTSTSTSTTDAPTTGDDTGGGGSLPDACKAVCTHWDMCKPGVVGPVPECITGCVDDFGGEPGCALAIANQWDCVAGLSCEEALKFIESSPTSCLNELQATDEACSQLDCGGEVGGDEMTCEFQQQCDGVTQAFVCDLEVCTCKEEGMPDKECASNGFCMLEPPEQRAAITECCGWNWDLPTR